MHYCQSIPKALSSESTTQNVGREPRSCSLPGTPCYHTCLLSSVKTTTAACSLVTKSIGLRQPMLARVPATLYRLIYRLYTDSPLKQHACHHEQAISFQPDLPLELLHTIFVQATAAAKSTSRNAQGLLKGEGEKAGYWTWLKAKFQEENKNKKT